MGTEYAGTATWRTTVTLPSDNETDSSTVRNHPAQDLADRTVYLKGEIEETAGGIVAVQGEVDALEAVVASQGVNFDRLGKVVLGFSTIAKRIRSQWPVIDVAPSNLQRNEIGTVEDFSPSPQIVAFFPLSMLFDDATIVQVGFTVRGVNYASLPATMPKVELVRRSSSTMAETVLATVTDATSPVGSFNVWHTLTVACSIVVDGDFEYYLRLYSPSAVNNAAVEYGPAWVEVL